MAFAPQNVIEEHRRQDPGGFERRRRFWKLLLDNFSEQAKVQTQLQPPDGTVKLVRRRDDLDPLCDEDCLTAELSCGHAVSPDSLAQWCRSQLDQGKYKFRCPALVEGTKLCNKPWSSREVHSVLSGEEKRHFEEAVARLAAEQYCEIQQCPRCKTSVERKALDNLCVECTICKADLKKTYYFCWQCHGEWKGKAPRSDRCDNDGCSNRDLQVLQTCQTISLPEVQGATACPTVRACPTCGLKVQHNRQHCKNILCPRCSKEFCFICLELKSTCSQTSSPYSVCPRGVAPRQTSIPVWHRKKLST